MTPVTPQSPVLNQQYGVNAWAHWVRQCRRLGPDGDPSPLSQDPLQCHSAQLSGALTRFVQEVRRPGGQSYGPDSLFYLCLGIQQHLFAHGRTDNIFMDERYGAFASQLSAMLQAWRPPALTPGGVLSSRVHESFLWDCHLLGASSPAVLLNTVLYFCAKGFGLRALGQHQSLRFCHLATRSKPDAHGAKVQWLEYRQGDQSLELPENVVDRSHCPVRLFEFYLSRCPESAKRSLGLFYLQPERNVTHGPDWYSCQPLEGATLQTMLSRILAVEEVIQQWGAGPPLLSPSP